MSRSLAWLNSPAIAATIADRPRSRYPSASSLRPERADLRAGLEPVAADQVEAIGDCGKHGVETGADRGRLARQVDDQAAAPQPRELTRKDRGRHFEQAARPHQLAEARHQPIAD